MDVGGLWRAVEMTSKICNVIVYLKDEPNYSREEAAKDLEHFLSEYMEPIISTAFTNDPEKREEDEQIINT